MDSKNYTIHIFQIHVIITNGFCSMGFALPGAIAAQLVRPKSESCCQCVVMVLF